MSAVIKNAMAYVDHLAVRVFTTGFSMLEVLGEHSELRNSYTQHFLPINKLHTNGTILLHISLSVSRYRQKVLGKQKHSRLASCFAYRHRTPVLKHARTTATTHH